MTTNTLLILIGLNLCHFLGDYTHLSTQEMLKSKRTGKAFPYIIMHGFIHAFLMGLFLIYIIPHKIELWYGLFMFQFLSHTVIDVLKGKLNVWFPALANPANKYHWYVFGADQFLHQLVIIIMTYYATA